MNTQSKHHLEARTGPPQSSGKGARLLLLALLGIELLAASPSFAAIAPPSTPNMTASTDSGVFSTDNITNVAQPFFSGTGKAFSVVALFSDGKQVGQSIASSSGQWTVAENAKLSDGPHAMTVRQTFGGEQSVASSPLHIVIDTVSPPAPSQPDLIASSDHGISDTDNQTNTLTPTFAGTSGAGESISLLNTLDSNTIVVGTGKASAVGNWKATISATLPKGEYSIRIAARATDTAGNISPFSPGLTVGIDTVLPANAGLPDLLAASDSGASNSDNITNLTALTFNVKVQAYDKVVLTGINSVAVVLGTGVANQFGVAIIKVPKIAVNNYSVVAMAFDKSGNKAANYSPTLALSIDTTPPDAPSAPLLDPNFDSGAFNDNLTNIKTPVVHGQSTDIGNFPVDVKFFAGIFAYHTIVPVKFTAYSAKAPALPDGVYAVTATNTDIAGNSSTSPATQITIDTIAPPVPSTPDLTVDTGVSSTDNKTGQNPLELSGTCVGVLKIIIYNNGFEVASNDSGFNQWLVKAKLVHPGPFHLSAASVDMAGNVSAQSAQLSGMLDTSAPLAVLLTTPSPAKSVVKNLDFLAGTAKDSIVNGDSSGLDNVGIGIRRYDGVVNGNAFWSGSAWVQANLELPTTLANGKWSKSSGLPSVGAKVATQIQDGDYAVLLFSTDQAGNETQSSVPFTVDNTAPGLNITAPFNTGTAQVLNDIHGTSNDATGVTQVLVELKRTRNNLSYYWNGSTFTTASATISANVAGNKKVNWDCVGKLPTTADLDTGPYTITVSAYDAVNNVGTATRSITVSARGLASSPPTRSNPSGGSS